MLETALRTAMLHDIDGRPLRTLGDLVSTLPPLADGSSADPLPDPPALDADADLADAVGTLLSGPHAAGDAVTVGAHRFAARDVFARLAAALAHSTLYDPLTGLPTRPWLLDEVGRRLAGASHEAPLGLLQIELGQLKDINDSLGYEVGDAMIVEAGRRLAEAVGPDDAVARLVGDEFAVVLSGLAADDPTSARSPGGCSTCSPSRSASAATSCSCGRASACAWWTAASATTRSPRPSTCCAARTRR